MLVCLAVIDCFDTGAPLVADCCESDHMSLITAVSMTGVASELAGNIAVTVDQARVEVGDQIAVTVQYLTTQHGSRKNSPIRHYGFRLGWSKKFRDHRIDGLMVKKPVPGILPGAIALWGASITTA